MPNEEDEAVQEDEPIHLTKGIQIARLSKVEYSKIYYTFVKSDVPCKLWQKSKSTSKLESQFI